MFVLVNGNELLKFVDDAQLRIKSLSTSVYVDPHKVRLLWGPSHTSCTPSAICPLRHRP